MAKHSMIIYEIEYRNIHVLQVDLFSGNRITVSQDT